MTLLTSLANLAFSLTFLSLLARHLNHYLSLLLLLLDEVLRQNRLCTITLLLVSPTPLHALLLQLHAPPTVTNHRLTRTPESWVPLLFFAPASALHCFGGVLTGLALVMFAFFLVVDEVS